MRTQRNPLHLRQGMTLTELLVVIMILAILMGTALPVMRTAMQDRPMREASRQLNTYIQLAKAEAAATGRPVGVWLETETLDESVNPANAPFSRQLFLAETPPPYSGDTVDARLRLDVGNYEAVFATTLQQTQSQEFFNVVVVGDEIQFGRSGSRFQIYQLISGTATVRFTRQLTQTPPQTPPLPGDQTYQVYRDTTTLIYSGEVPAATIRVLGGGNYRAAFTVDQLGASTMFSSLTNLGDSIKFDFKGSAYRIVELLPNANPPSLRFLRQSSQSPPVGRDVKYQVFRSPQRSGTMPRELRGGAVIDLSHSGIGLTGLEFSSVSTSIQIMFSPDGSVHRVLTGGISEQEIPFGSFHLLIGSLGNMMEIGAYSSDDLGHYNRNLDDTANRWVSITARDGRVITTENAPAAPDPPPAWQPRTAYGNTWYVADSADSYCRPVTSSDTWAANNAYFAVVQAGRSGTSEPSWPTNVGDTVPDGTVIWRRISRQEAFRALMLSLAREFAQSGQAMGGN